MLRIIEAFNHLPQSFYVDSEAKFEPGQIGSLKIKNNKTIITVCDGINPIGILDDVKNTHLRGTVFNKQYLLPLYNCKIGENSELILTQDYKLELEHVNIISKSFVCSIPAVLDSKKGIITIPAGTVLKCEIYSLIINSVPTAIIYINYAFKIKSIDDSTVSTGQTTVWNKVLIADTDMFDTTVEYNKYDNLYSNNGLFTTKKSTYENKCVGVVLTPPNADSSMLRFLFDPNNDIKIGGKHE